MIGSSANHSSFFSIHNLLANSRNDPIIQKAIFKHTKIGFNPRLTLVNIPKIDVSAPKFEKIQVCPSLNKVSFFALAFFYSTLNIDPCQQQNLSEKILRKANTLEFIDEAPDLSQYPPVREQAFNADKQFTIGDLHANALKLLYFLVRENVVYLSKEDYLAFVEIYEKDVDLLTEDDINEFHEILNEMQVGSPLKGGLVRLIGDELCDRGQNDYFILKILEALSKQNISFEILFSNHGYEFIYVHEKGLMETFSYFEKSGCGTSLTNLRYIISKQLVSLDEVNHLISHIYKPSLKLVSYTAKICLKFPSECLRFNFNKNSASFCDQINRIPVPLRQVRYVTIYSHAPIGLSTIRHLSSHSQFSIDFDDSSIYKIGQTIQKINERFQSILVTGEFSKQFNDEVHANAPLNNIPSDLPIKRCLWSRGFQKDDTPKRTNENYRVNYVHGHDGAGQVNPAYDGFVTNLDNDLGKGRGCDDGIYSVLVHS